MINLFPFKTKFTFIVFMAEVDVGPWNTVSTASWASGSRTFSLVNHPVDAHLALKAKSTHAGNGFPSSPEHSSLKPVLSSLPRA